ncbi:hypothetical protein L0664_15540 [Octadecabacter sp. G9-8]|uniref:DUF2946 domain-containing protein n=1 Tax=Octadecabacter dasysiphoniae TaxID=2909341 RepID=A0ABS9CZ97_9RHOB|nr:hypothetical protein [Octadecabacter dasysiphoniae]MCF2872488.1 hypothetical protein [Octadecabacter dasysiphoniae]
MTRMFTLALALLIAVTSQQMATARAMMVDASGQVVLCTGDGTITVTLDAMGNLVEGSDETAHFCPDCALTFADVPRAVGLADGAVVHIQTLLQLPVAALETPVIPTPVHARGPPEFA